MVSFWPFKGDESSAASFEKTLSSLSQKITKTSSQNDNFRQQQRRYKVLWTLYTSFAYILIAAILTLVTGWETWGTAEYSTIAGTPLLIYGVRTALDLYFNYRIANSQNYLDSLVKQREATIDKLKTATKYNSTQQLLDKYGGTPKKPQAAPQPSGKRKSEGLPSSSSSTPQGGRTGFMPPPTANIPGRPSPQGPIPQQRTALEPAQPPPDLSEEFAPNAFSTAPPPSVIPQSSAQYATEGPKWYDRIMDVVLGEDETQAKNRIALICKSCRLVNGQAPPGTRTLEEVGKWRCSSCQAWNGVESEENKLLKQVGGGDASPVSPVVDKADVSGLGNDTSDYEEVDEESDDEDHLADPTVGSASDVTPSGSTRSKARQRKGI